MIGAGTFINPIIKVATTVAILAAVYFFLVKPALDTTNKAIDASSQFSNQINRQVSHAFGDIGKTEQTKIKQAIDGKRIRIPNAQIPSSAKAQMKIAECVQKAAPDTAKMQVCVEN